MGARSQGDFSNLVTASSSAGAAAVSLDAVCENAPEPLMPSAAQNATSTDLCRPTLPPESRILRRLLGSVPLLAHPYATLLTWKRSLGISCVRLRWSVIDSPTCSAPIRSSSAALVMPQSQRS